MFERTKIGSFAHSLTENGMEQLHLSGANNSLPNAHILISRTPAFLYPCHVKVFVCPEVSYKQWFISCNVSSQTVQFWMIRMSNVHVDRTCSRVSLTDT